MNLDPKTLENQILHDQKYIEKLRGQGAVDLAKEEQKPLHFRLFPDYENSVIVLEFDQPTGFVGFNLDQSRVIARTIRQLANKIEKANREEEDGSSPVVAKGAKKHRRRSRKSKGNSQ